MTIPSPLPALLARVKAASWGGRELDGRIMFDLFAKPCSARGYLWPEDNPSWSFALRSSVDPFVARKRHDGETIAWKLDDDDWLLMNSLRVPPLTSSLDAALALVERVLPNMCVENLGEMSPDCGPLAGHWLAQLRPRAPRRRLEGPITAANLQATLDGSEPVSAPTPALALLAALLTALIAKGEAGE